MVDDDGIIQQYRCRGNYGGTVARPVIKWSLNVPMEFYASFVQCMFCVMSWSSSLLIHFFLPLRVNNCPSCGFLDLCLCF